MNTRALALVASGPGSTPSIAQASAAVERAWERLCDARDAFACATHDLDVIFQRQADWTAAIGAYESAKLALRSAVARGEGRSWLRVVGENQ
jgi:hypothetical protein